MKQTLIYEREDFPPGQAHAHLAVGPGRYVTAIARPMEGGTGLVVVGGILTTTEIKRFSLARFIASGGIDLSIGAVARGTCDGKQLDLEIDFGDPRIRTYAANGVMMRASGTDPTSRTPAARP